MCIKPTTHAYARQRRCKMPHTMYCQSPCTFHHCGKVFDIFVFVLRNLERLRCMIRFQFILESSLAWFLGRAHVHTFGFPTLIVDISLLKNACEFVYCLSQPRSLHFTCKPCHPSLRLYGRFCCLRLVIVKKVVCARRPVQEGACICVFFRSI